MKNKIIFLFVFLSLVLSACKKEFLKPTWYNIKPIPPSFTEFPFSVNHFTPLIIYDHDWPASTKTFYLYPPSIYLFPNTNVYNVKFKPRMTNSSTKLIAWGNITLSDIQNGWYLPVNYCPDGRYGIYHFN